MKRTTKSVLGAVLCTLLGAAVVLPSEAKAQGFGIHLDDRGVGITVRPDFDRRGPDHRDYRREDWREDWRHRRDDRRGDWRHRQDQRQIQVWVTETTVTNERVFDRHSGRTIVVTKEFTERRLVWAQWDRQRGGYWYVDREGNYRPVR